MFFNVGGCIGLLIDDTVDEVSKFIDVNVMAVLELKAVSTLLP